MGSAPPTSQAPTGRNNLFRLPDAELLMRRALEITLYFTRATGHPHPHLNTAFNNYRHLLTKLGDTPTQAQAKLAGLAQSHGVSLGLTIPSASRRPSANSNGVPSFSLGLPRLRGYPRSLPHKFPTPKGLNQNRRRGALKPP